MRSSHIVTVAVSGLLVALVACSPPGASSAAPKEVEVIPGTDGGEGDGGEGGMSSGSSGSSSGSSGGVDGSAGGDGGVPDAAVVGAGNDRCDAATDVALNAANPRVDLLASTLGAAHDVDAPCSGDQSPDVFYKFAFSKRVFIYADTFGASWNTVLFLTSDDCTPLTTVTTPGDALCNSGACGTSQSQIVAVLEPGRYRLGLSGRGGAAGAATIHLQWTLAGSGNIAPLPQGTSVQTGTTGGDGNISGLDSQCIAAAGEDSYWWARCPSDAGGMLHASTCGGTSWESIVELQLPNATPYQWSLDGCGLQAKLAKSIPAGAGLAVVSIDGQKGNSFGDYTMNVTRP